MVDNVITLLLILAAIAQPIYVQEAKPISLRSATVSDYKAGSPDEVHVELSIKNSSENEIRLLNAYEDSAIQHFFFLIDLRDAKGTPVETAGGGKISFSRDTFRYINLGKGDEYKIVIDLSRYVPGLKSLRPGDYLATVTYMNQYGEDCFKGTVRSNPVTIKILE